MISNFIAVWHDSNAIMIAIGVVTLLTLFENRLYLSRNLRFRRIQYAAASLGIAALIAGMTFFSRQ